MYFYFRLILVEAFTNMKLIILALTVPLLLDSAKAASITFSPFASITTQEIILSQSNWQQFYSKAGNFTVSLPGKPIEESETYDDGSVANNFTVVDKETVYLVTYADVVEVGNQVDPIETFDAVCEGYTADGDTIINKQEIELNGHPGRLVEFKTTDGAVGKASIYLVKNRLYQLILISPNKEEGKQFFDSFKIK